MNTRDTFNVSANDAEKQKKQEYERDREETSKRKRLEDISRIKDENLRREARTMLNHRDNELAIECDKQEALIQRAGDDAVSRDRLENHKFEQYAPKREDYVRTQIRQRMELDFAPENKALEQDLNRKIDDFVERTIEGERENAPQKSFKDRLRDEYKQANNADRERNQERKNDPTDRKP